MEHDELDRSLLDDESIVPSSGFASGVMDAVRQEALERTAMPFPWRRALPGLVMTAVAISVTGLSGFLALNQPATPESVDGVRRLLVAMLASTPHTNVGSLLLAAIVTAVSVTIPLRLTR